MEDVYTRAAWDILDHFEYDQMDPELIAILKEHFPMPEPEQQKSVQYPPADDEELEWIDTQGPLQGGQIE